MDTNEITKKKKVTAHLKHHLIIKLGYDMGLSVSENVSLRVSNIDSTRMRGLIQRGRQKGLAINLPKSVLDELRKY